MAALLSEEASRLLHMERALRGAGLPVGGPGLASPATFKRDLSRLRSEMGAVVVWDTQCRRYFLKNREWPGVLPHVLSEAATV